MLDLELGDARPRANKARALSFRFYSCARRSKTLWRLPESMFILIPPQAAPRAQNDSPASSRSARRESSGQPLDPCPFFLSSFLLLAQSGIDGWIACASRLGDRRRALGLDARATMSGRGLSRFYMLRVAFGKSSIFYVHILRDHLTMTLRSMRRRLATARVRTWRVGPGGRSCPRPLCQASQSET